jgi:hypothetical protein
MHPICNPWSLSRYHIYGVNKEANSILTKIAHCSSTWWYWHWVKKVNTQGTIASLLNSFESDAADNAHDFLYNPQSMSVTSMFAGDDKNQWLDQVEEEFGSNLSDHDEDNINSSCTTIELDKDAKASLAKEMKGKDYDLEGIKSRSSKRIHCTNMTGKTEMTLTRSIATKKIAMDFSQQKRDLNAEQKKTAALEQRLKAMESALTAGKVHAPLHTKHPALSQTKAVSISVPSTASHTTLAQKFDTHLNLPPPLP